MTSSYADWITRQLTGKKFCNFCLPFPKNRCVIAHGPIGQFYNLPKDASLFFCLAHRVYQTLVGTCRLTTSVPVSASFIELDAATERLSVYQGAQLRHVISLGNMQIIGYPVLHTRLQNVSLTQPNSLDARKAMKNAQTFCCSKQFMSKNRIQHYKPKNY